MNSDHKVGRRMSVFFLVLTLLFMSCAGLTSVALTNPSQSDLDSLIGQPGSIGGSFAKAIGVYGNYDDDLFTASIDQDYPGIRLDLKDMPGTAIVITNVPFFRYSLLLSDSEPDSEEFYLSLPLRLNSNSQLVPHRSIGSEIEILSEDPYGAVEVGYKIHYADRTMSVVDIIWLASSSHLIVRLEYPEDDQATLERLRETADQLHQRHADRAAPFYADYDLMREGEINTVEDIVAYLEEFPIYFSGAEDRRENAELVIYMYTVALIDAISISSNMMYARESESDLEANERIINEFLALEPYGFTNEYVMDDAGRLSEHIVSAEAGTFFARYLDHLPTSYADPISQLQTSEAHLYPKKALVTSEDWLNYALAATDLAMLIGAEPTWLDPIWSRYQGTIANIFSILIRNHRTPEGTLNEAVLQAYQDYLLEADRLREALPDGHFDRHIGPYANNIATMLERIEAEGNKPLDDAELAAILDEFDMFNMGKADE